MPKQTFFNLPESKRRAIIEIAIEEFAQHDYRNASLSRIVAKAGIAKGSIYQYFEDKRELFLYLLDLAGQEKVRILKEMPAPPELDFFAYLRWLAAMAAKVQFANPRLATVAYRAYYGDLPFHEEAVAQFKGASERFIRQLVEKAIAAGDIDPDLDPDLAVFVVNTLLMELGNFITQRAGVGPAGVKADGTLAVDMQLVEEVFDDFTRVLQFGLAKRSGERDGGHARSEAPQPVPAEAASRPSGRSTNDG